MADEDTTTTDDGAKPDADQTTTETKPDDLGPGGEKALREERTARKAAEKAAKAATERLAEIEAANATEAEKAIAQAKKEGRNEALTTANERLLKAEVKAAAAGVLADPDDAARLLDLSSFEVGEDGDVDSKPIKAAIASLVKEKPYLAANGSKPAPLPGGAATAANGQSMDDWLRSQAQ